MWRNMMGWGNGFGMFGFGHLLWWALILAVVFLLVRAVLPAGGRGSASDPDDDRALSILKERYARGEIDQAEFDERRRRLE